MGYRITSHYRNLPFELPEGWVWARLGEIAFLKAGSFVKAENIENKYQDNLFPCYGGNGLRGYVETFTHEGIYSLIGRQGALCENINLVKGKFHATEHAIVTFLYCNIDPLWMFFTLKALNLNQYSIGAAQPGLSVERINKVSIPLPPLVEQQRIVSVIEASFKLVDEIEVDEQDLAQFIKQTKSKILNLAICGKLVPQDPNDEPASILLERIKTEYPDTQKKASKTRDNSHYPFEIPKSWTWTQFSDCLALLSGRDLLPSEYSNSPIGIPYIIGASNITNNQIYINRWTTTPKVISKRNDILLTCKGTVGDMVINTIGDVHIARQLMAIRVNSICEVRYIKYCIYHYINQIKENARGVIPGISREDVLFLQIPIPPIAEQKRIVRKVKEIFVSLNTIEKSTEA